MDIQLQIELAIRLLVAAVLGGLVGAERELHDHPAGMRTHLLVAVGCALFTELSVYGFVGVLPAGSGSPVDPSRVAAQIVTGMGFIGGGAILKYGATIRGLTTAASLWTIAAVGVAAGVGQYVIACVGVAIVLVSLWPLHRVSEALRLRNDAAVRFRVTVDDLARLADISTSLAGHGVDMRAVETHRTDSGRHEVDIDARLTRSARAHTIVADLAAIPGVDVEESSRVRE